MPQEPFDLQPYHPIALDDLGRLGRDHDGGYVISTRCIAATQALVAFGISGDWSFEQDFAHRQPAARVVGVDGSVSAPFFLAAALRAFVRGVGTFVRAKPRRTRALAGECLEKLTLAYGLRRFFGTRGNVFHRRFLRTYSDRDAITWTALHDAERLPRRAGGAPPLFVKMDVEGAEYAVLPHLLADADDINGMVIEFHDLHVHWPEFARTMEQLLAHFAVAHVHGNNYRPCIAGSETPSTLEISLVHRSLLAEPPSPSRRSYPIPGLDQPNDRDRADYPLFR